MKMSDVVAAWLCRATRLHGGYHMLARNSDSPWRSCRLHAHRAPLLVVKVDATSASNTTAGGHPTGLRRVRLDLHADEITARTPLTGGSAKSPSGSREARLRTPSGFFAPRQRGAKTPKGCEVVAGHAPLGTVFRDRVGMGRFS